MDTDGYKFYIDGQWINKDETFPDYNPATGDVWAEIPNGTRQDASKAEPARHCRHVARSVAILQRQDQPGGSVRCSRRHLVPGDEQFR